MGHYARQYGGRKKNYKHDNPQEEEMIMEIIQKMMGRHSSKPEDFP